MFLSVDHIVQSGGILAICLIIFAESGLLIGFFLPGDTLLIAAGLFAAQGRLPLSILLICVAIAAIIGYHVGYVIGRRAGPRIFKRKDGLLFREEYIEKAENFSERHGWKAVLLARFVPVVRTIVPVVAGMGKMDRRVFTFFNVAGGVVWIVSIVLGSYWLGNQFPDLDKFIIPLLIVAMILTTGSILLQFMRSKERRRELRRAMREEYNYFFKKKSV
jgi:membrane-associated protein